MKKLILLLLTATLLILPLSGCFADNKQNEGTTPNNTTENTTPEATTPEATTPPENDQNDPPMVEGELDKNSELITNLIAYLDQILVEYNIFEIPFCGKIDGIKNGAQPLHVAFDPTNYYFVCGYYIPTEEDSEWNYCCADEYTWVQYENETEIPEYYNDRKLIVAFQINRALTVTDLVTGEATNNMEHFQMYYLVFENGFNKASPIIFEETFIYLNNFLQCFDEDMIYHSISWYYHRNHTINCVSLDDQYYISYPLGTLKTDETFNVQDMLSKSSIKYAFGNYYDALTNMMDTEKYRVNTSAGSIHYYGVISLDDFVNKIIK